MSPIEINEVLNGIDLEHPVTLEDVAAVRAALGGNVEVFTRARELVVQLHREGQKVYERVLPIAGAPPVRIIPV
jgi:hypothetical protein